MLAVAVNCKVWGSNDNHSSDALIAAVIAAVAIMIAVSVIGEAKQHKQIYRGHFISFVKSCHGTESLGISQGL